MAMASGVAISRAISRCSASNAAGADAARLISPITSPSTMSGEETIDRRPLPRSGGRRGGNGSGALARELAENGRGVVQGGEVLDVAEGATAEHFGGAQL